MIKNLSKKTEFSHFSKIAKEWWKPNGKFQILHKINPLRIEYILKNINQKKIEKLEILDLGCGGGLVCEPLSRLKAKITGIDFVKENIDIAKQHAKISKLKIQYIHDDLNFLKISKKFDVILLLEVLEHMENWKTFIKKVKKLLKPNGILIISTINRTKFSKFFAIFLAENFLNWVPKNTHDYSKLITPVELHSNLNECNFNVLDTSGMNYNPLLRTWSINKNLYKINYFCTAKLN